PVRRQPSRQCRVVVGAGVEFGAVARRQQGHLAHPRQGAQVGQRGRDVALGERDLLAQGDRGGLVVDAEGVQGHALWLAARTACPFRRLRYASGSSAHSKVRPTPMPVFPNSVRRILPCVALSACLAVAWAAPPPASDPLREDVLGATMAGEFAPQAGRLDEAAAWYLDAARAAGDGDPGLAERATRIALLGKDDRTAAAALALWRARAPESLAMRAAEATLALRNGRSRRALRHLRGLMAEPDPAGWRHALAVIATGPRDPAASARIMRALFDEDAVPDTLHAWLAFGDLAQ